MAFMSGTIPTPGVPAGAPVGGTTDFTDLYTQYGGGVPSAGMGASALPTEPMLYLGSFYPKAPATGYGDDVLDWALKGASPEKQDKIATINEAVMKFDNMSFSEQRNMLRLLAIGGFAGSISLEDIDDAVKEATQPDARAAYLELLETASDYYMNTGAMVSPNDVLRSAIAYRLGGMGIKWDGDFGDFDDGISKDFLTSASDSDELKPYSTTNTSRSVDFMNPKDAKGLTRAMLQQELGRDPTQAEYEDFLSALHAAERQNPDVTTTTTQYTPNAKGIAYNTSTSSTTQEGIGAEGLAQVAYEEAQSQPGWAEWQAMGTYFPALLSALGATVPGA